MDVDQEVRWTRELGTRLERARGAMSKREAARRAGFSESTWRALELGVRRPARGVEVPVNPTVGTLQAAASAVGLPAVDVLGLVGITWAGDEDEPFAADEDVDDRLRKIEERLDQHEGRIDEILAELREAP